MKFKKRNIQVVDHSTGQTLDFPTFGKVAGEEAITELEKNVDNKIADLKSMVGTPLKASTASAMNDSEKIYVYTGSESGYTNGHWYYNDDGRWVDGGVYNSTAVETDKTLSIENMPADAKKTGDEVNALKNTLTALTDLPLTWVEGYYLSKTGAKSPHESYKYSERYRINSPISFQIAYKMLVFSNIATYVLYDEDLTILSIESTSSSSLVWDESVITVTDPRAKYISFCTNKANGVYVKASSIYSIGIGDGAIDSSMLNSGSVTIDKVGDDVITHDGKSNYIDYALVQTGKYVMATGKVGTSTNVNITDYIPLKAGKTYYQSGVYQTYYAYYDSDKNFVASYSTLGNLATAFTVPEGCAYGRFTITDFYYNGRSAWIAESNGAPSAYKKTINTDNINVYAQYDPLDISNPCDYTGRDVSAFNKCICIGDSLTEGTFNYRVDGSTAYYVNYTKYSYPTFFQKLTNMETTNKGHGGMSTVQWWNAEQNSDLSSYDLAIIQLGVNDVATGQTEWPAESKTAMTNIINKLIAENTNIKIFVANILPATSYGGRSHISTGIANLVAELANPNVMLLDMAQYSHVGQRTDYNCGHLSAYGYWRLAQDYVSYISYIMATDNAEVFKEIQFIGTNYQYHS